MMKKFVSMMISICILLTFGITSLASESFEDINETNGYSTKLNDIPIFVTAVDGITDFTEEQKNVISDVISKTCSSGTLGADNPELKNYGVIQLTNAQKINLLNSPVYASTFIRIAEVIDSGVAVKYINLFTPISVASDMTSGIFSSRGNADDIAYWESNCPYLGTYNGYKFLYLESAFGVETSEVTPGNISGSWNWSTIANKTLEVVLNHYVKDNFYKAVRAVAKGLSTLFSIYENPLNITYGVSQGYVKAKVSGDVYIRTVFIRDDLDRVQGYAYYSWGSTERFAAALRVDAKYPYKKNISGTYEYRYPSYTFSTQQSSTPGYYGNPTLFSSIISLYTNTIGYFTHNEYIDINSAVASLLG